MKYFIHFLDNYFTLFFELPRIRPYPQFLSIRAIISASGCLLAIALTVSFLNSDFGLPSEKGAEGTTSAIADSLFNSFLLPFEIASLVLLAAVIGSIVLAQGSDE